MKSRMIVLRDVPEPFSKKAFETAKFLEREWAVLAAKGVPLVDIPEALLSSAFISGLTMATECFMSHAQPDMENLIRFVQAARESLGEEANPKSWQERWQESRKN